MPKSCRRDSGNHALNGRLDSTDTPDSSRRAEQQQASMAAKQHTNIAHNIPAPYQRRGWSRAYEGGAARGQEELLWADCGGPDLYTVKPPRQPWQSYESSRPQAGSTGRA